MNESVARSLEQEEARLLEQEETKSICRDEEEDSSIPPLVRRSRNLPAAEEHRRHSSRAIKVFSSIFLSLLVLRFLIVLFGIHTL